MTKPTKHSTRDEVLNPRRYEISNCDSDPIVDACAFGGDWIKSNDFERLKSLYLAQEEELKEERDKAKKLYDICIFNEQTMSMLLEHNRELEAENQELKAKGEQLCCRVGVLEMENQALKATIETLDHELRRVKGITHDQLERGEGHSDANRVAEPYRKMLG